MPQSNRAFRQALRVIRSHEVDTDDRVLLNRRDAFHPEGQSWVRRMVMKFSGGSAGMSCT